MLSSREKSTVFDRNLTDAEGYTAKNRKTSDPDRPAYRGRGTVRQIFRRCLAGFENIYIPLGPLAAGPVLLRLCAPGTVLRPDLAGRVDSPGLPAQAARDAACLPGLGVCALYPRQCLARADSCDLDRQVRRSTPRRLCQHDG